VHKNLAFDVLRTHSTDVDGIQNAYQRRIQNVHTELASGEIKENELPMHLEALDQALRCLISHGAPSPQRQIPGLDGTRFTGFHQNSMFAGRYRLERELGYGRSCNRWAAWDQVESKSVALKFLAPLRSGEREILRRRLTDLIVWRHQCFVQTYTLCEDANTVAISSEFIDGTDLQSDFLLNPPGCRARPIADWLAVLCDGLGAAYEEFGFAHGAISALA
jgi:hypothetical protein